MIKTIEAKKGKERVVTTLGEKSSWSAPRRAPRKAKKFKRRCFKEYSFLKSFISGGVSASIAKTIFAPVSRIKLIFVVKIDLIGIKPISSL